MAEGMGQGWNAERSRTIRRSVSANIGRWLWMPALDGANTYGIQLWMRQTLAGKHSYRSG